jgi:hypothetical protein
MAIFRRSSTIGATLTTSNISAVVERESHVVVDSNNNISGHDNVRREKLYPVPMNHSRCRCGVGKGQWTKVGCTGFVVWDGGDNNGVCGVGEVGGERWYSPTMQQGRKNKGYLYILPVYSKNNGVIKYHIWIVVLHQ